MRIVSVHGVTAPVLLGLLLVCGCDQDLYPQAERTTDAEIIRIALPEMLGVAERPAVEFDHQAHTKALEQEGCSTCHPENSKRQLLPRLNIKNEPSNSAEWMLSHHELCVGCHDERRRAGKSTGPDDCGRCHVKREAAWLDVDRTMRFDYSLHYRHARASEDKCETCHHIYDEKQKKLVYKKGTEDACSACHRPLGKQDETSLGDAVHIACINCHMQGQDRSKTGPTLCTGCHDARERAKIAKVKEVPRLDRGQPKVMWIATKGATDGAVAFNHLLHEARVDSCSSCHHESIGKCDLCHTQLPQPKGGGITLNQAYHTPGSTLSCVGCHKEHSERDMCAGCHHMLPRPPGKSACDYCHSGPRVDEVDRKSSPAALLAPRELPELPAVSANFPEKLEIKVLADKYRPARFPHEKIVAALDRAVRGNKLAERFHKGTETLCAGCHHNSPPGDPLPACRSCHADENYPQKDLPGLNAAYHRQCIGCHQAIGHEAQGCTNCHEESRE
ncbi:MAG: hypothetical protein JXA30_17810 [Deltaproteobacteria bacterium]|nr:hypothetical protein [Deltaproteobacteria bacterium]